MASHHEENLKLSARARSSTGCAAQPAPILSDAPERPFVSPETLLA